MSNEKTLKSIDLSSTTIVGTGVTVLLSIIVSIVLLIGLGAYNSGLLASFVTIVPTIIFATLMIGVYEIFTRSFLYNILVSKLNNIKFVLEGNEIKSISVMSTSLILAVISTIMFIIAYLASLFIIPLVFSGLSYSLMMMGMMEIAYALYYIISIMTTPLYGVLAIIGVFVASLVYNLVTICLYNLLTPRIGGINVELSEEGNYTLINSINPLKIAIILSVISLIINLVIGIISSISTKNYLNIVSNGVGGFISTFITMALLAIFYNFLSSKLGKIKIELE